MSWTKRNKVNCYLCKKDMHCNTMPIVWDKQTKEGYICIRAFHEGCWQSWQNWEYLNEAYSR